MRLQDGDASPTREGRQPARVRLPGFLAEEEVGLGTLLKRVTSALGIRACGGCERRAARLDRMVRLTGRQRGRG